MNDNLGLYKWLVIQAKEAGGVELLLKGIKKAAVASAAPKLVVAGAAAGVAIGVAGVKGVEWAKDAMARRSATIADGDAAEAELKAGIQDAERAMEAAADAPDDPDVESPE